MSFKGRSLLGLASFIWCQPTEWSLSPGAPSDCSVIENSTPRGCKNSRRSHNCYILPYQKDKSLTCKSWLFYFTPEDSCQLLPQLLPGRITLVSDLQSPCHSILLLFHFFSLQRRPLILLIKWCIGGKGMPTWINLPIILSSYLKEVHSSLRTSKIAFLQAINLFSWRATKRVL